MNQTWCSGFYFSLVQLLRVTTCWVSHQLLTLSIISCRRWDDQTVAKEGLWLCHNCTGPSVWLIFCTVLHLASPVFLLLWKKEINCLCDQGSYSIWHAFLWSKHTTARFLLFWVGGGLKKNLSLSSSFFLSLFCCCCYCVWYIGKMS